MVGVDRLKFTLIHTSEIFPSPSLPHMISHGSKGFLTTLFLDFLTIGTIIYISYTKVDRRPLVMSLSRVFSF